MTVYAPRSVKLSTLSLLCKLCSGRRIAIPRNRELVQNGFDLRHICLEQGKIRCILDDSLLRSGPSHRHNHRHSLSSALPLNTRKRKLSSRA